MKLGKDEVGIVGVVGLILLMIGILSFILLGPRYISFVSFAVFGGLGLFMCYYDGKKHKQRKANSAS